MMPKSASMFYRQAELRRGFRGHGPLLRGIARYLWERALPAKQALRCVRPNRGAAFAATDRSYGGLLCPRRARLGLAAAPRSPIRPL
ncbi:hypothetical protein AHFPHNDE_03850 [Pseudomonas sp. MM227]|nr:hypothetical protein AHFPHNDE_03850 [Pseudomonas sp. MM227]